ncbi:MAG: BREX system P-loop protein BrxC [Thermoanaerobaculia bacterium]
MNIRQLFEVDRDPTRPLNEVINTEGSLDPRSEIDEYVFIPSTQEYLRTLIEGILDTAQGQSPDCLRGWISGFFGSGKSHFLKLSAALLENRPIRLPDGTEKRALEYAVARHKLDLPWERLAKDFRIQSVTVNLALAHGGGKLSQEMPLLYRLTSELNRAGGYSAVPHIAALEREIKKRKKWDAFLKAVRDHTASVGERKDDGSPFEWTDTGIRDYSSEAHRILEMTLPQVMPQYSNVRDYLRDREDERPSPESVIQLALDLANSLHKEMGRVLLCVDEVALYLRGKSGGFDGDRLREIQGLAETVKDKGRGRVFLFATAQLRVDTIDAEFSNLAEYVVFLRDRFPTGGRLALEERDIDTVVRERWLKKSESGPARDELTRLVKTHGGLLANAAKLRDESLVRETLPLTDEAAVVAYYPCLPFHIRLLQSILEALRGDQQIDQTAAQSRALLTSVRSLFDQRGARLADSEVGDLVTFDLVYDVIRDVVRKADSATDRWITETIASLGKSGSIPVVSVAKVVFLLQHLNPSGQRRLRVSAENVAALLYPRFGAPWEPHLKDVREACEKLVHEHFLADEPETGYRFYREQEQSFQKEVANQAIDEAKLRELLKSTLLQEARLLGLDTLSVKGGHKLDIALYVHHTPATLPNPLDPASALALHFLRPADSTPAKQTKVWAAHYASAPHVALWVLPGLSDAEDVARRVLKLESAIDAHVQKHGQQSRTLLKKEQQRLGEMKERLIPEAVRQALAAGTLIHRGLDAPLAATSQKPADHFRETMKEAVALVFEQLEDGCVVLDEAALRKVLAWRPPAPQPDYFATLKLFDSGGQPLLDRPFLKEVALAIQGRPEMERTGKAVLEKLSRAPYGWPERAIKAGIGALLRARRITVRLPDGSVVRSESDPKAEGWLTGTQQFVKSIFDLSDLNVSAEERQLLQRLFATAFERPGLDTLEKLEKEGPALLTGALSSAREALADLSGRNLPGAPLVQEHVTSLEAALQPDLAAGQLKALAVQLVKAPGSAVDPVAVVESRAALVRSVGKLRVQGKLGRIAQLKERLDVLYPAWLSRASGVPALVAGTAGTLRERAGTTSLLSEADSLLSDEAGCFAAYANDFAARHAARGDCLKEAVATVEHHSAWAGAPAAFQQEICSGFAFAQCPADGVITPQAAPDGRCPACRAGYGELLDHVDLIEARQAKALQRLDALAEPPSPEGKPTPPPGPPTPPPGPPPGPTPGPPTRHPSPTVTMKVASEDDLAQLFEKIQAIAKGALAKPRTVTVVFGEPEE